MALQALPNAAHYALAELARRMPGFITLSQNVDGLSQRAGHPRDNLQLLHGTLFEVKCTDPGCGYAAENFVGPITPALDIPTPRNPESAMQDISDATVPLPDIPPEGLPHCPRCTESLLRPNVVWFGEQLPVAVLDRLDEYLNESDHIDLIMVIGTGAKVYPAAGYIDHARYRSAKVCVINMDPNDVPPGGWKKGDWFFQGKLRSWRLRLTTARIM